MIDGDYFVLQTVAVYAEVMALIFKYEFPVFRFVGLFIFTVTTRGYGKLLCIVEHKLDIILFRVVFDTAGLQKRFIAPPGAGEKAFS